MYLSRNVYIQYILHYKKQYVYLVVFAACVCVMDSFVTLFYR